MRQFGEFRASQLFCKYCKTAVEVREVLLLVLPGKNLYDYRCKRCGNPVGTREEIDPQAFSMKPAVRRPRGTRM
jgi:hypothetical protein